MSAIGNIYVPHSGPEGAEILIIGESPGADEVRLHQPFVGKSGEFLRQILQSVGFTCASIDECNAKGNKANDSYNIRFANLCHFQPSGNNFEFLEGTAELKDGLSEIESYIERWKHKIRVCILLGERPLQYIGKKYKIGKWRGSVIVKDGINYIPCYHPSYIARNRSEYPILSTDLGKAYRVYSKGYTQPKFDFRINPSAIELEEILDAIRLRATTKASRVSVDIETIKNTNRILCAGIATSREKAICIVNRADAGLDSEFRRFFATILEDRRIEKIFHNGIFDIEVFHNNGVEVKNFAFDTMIAQHVLAPELEKGLDDINATYTDIPYYKDKGRTALPENEKGWGKIRDEDRITIYEYNCLDCVATYWCAEEMEKELDADPEYLRYTFDYEMSMHDAAFHIMRKGMPIDEERKNLLKSAVEARYVDDLALLNKIVGTPINVGSPAQKKKLLYETWGLPERLGKNSKVTTDENAIVSLISYTKDHINSVVKPATKYEWQKKLAGLMLILKLQGYRKLLGSYIDIEISHDGRARSSYKIPGAETGRWSCEKYLDDTGWNAQTLPRESLEYGS